MALTSSFLRRLSGIEQAFTISNEQTPLHVVCNLLLQRSPDPSRVRAAMDGLQQRHPLLRAGIRKTENGDAFYRLEPVPRLALSVTDPSDARQALTALLNEPFDAGGPLMRCVYGFSSAEKQSFLLVNFHHAIIDGQSARLLLHELLSLIGEEPLRPPFTTGMEVSTFPVEYRGFSMWGKMLRFLGRQLREEIRYSARGLPLPVPENSENQCFSIRLTEKDSRKLGWLAGKEGLGLNSLLLAVMILAVWRVKYPQETRRLVRLISFVDLRGGLIPPAVDDRLGCFISMLRLSVEIEQGVDPLSFGHRLRRALYRSGRRGEVYLMSRLSKYLIRMTWRLKRQRLGVVALSFIGRLDLRRKYGQVKLEDVQALITNNRFGTVYSGFGKLLHSRIGLDFNWLKAEVTDEEGRQIAKETEEILVDLANSE